MPAVATSSRHQQQSVPPGWMRGQRPSEHSIPRTPTGTAILLLRTLVSLCSEMQSRRQLRGAALPLPRTAPVGASQRRRCGVMLSTGWGRVVASRAMSAEVASPVVGHRQERTESAGAPTAVAGNQDRPQMRVPAALHWRIVCRLSERPGWRDRQSRSNEKIVRQCPCVAPSRGDAGTVSTCRV